MTAGRVIVWYILLVIASLAITVISSIAYAEEKPRAEFAAGLCRQSLIGDGVWYQSAYPYEADMTSNCGLIGIHAPVTQFGAYNVGVRVSYVNLGQITINSTFSMRDDEAKLASSGANCNPATMSGCVGRGSATQTARGFSVGATGERAFGPLTLGVEAGGFLYRGEFTTVIVAQPNPAAFGPYTIDWSGLQVTPYFGMNARYGYAMVMLRSYGEVRAARHGCGGCSGFSHSAAAQILGGLTIPF